MNSSKPKQSFRDDKNIHIITAENDKTSTFEFIATWLSLILIVITFPISVFLCFVVVKEYQRVVIFRLGRLRKGGARGPGLIFLIPCIDNYFKLDLRVVSFDVPIQQVLTRDSVTITLDAVVYYRLYDPLNGVIQVVNYKSSTQLLAQTTLRNVAGAKTLTEILVHRKDISNLIRAILDEATSRWGVKVERVEIKDIHLPLDLQRAMAAEAEATRDAKAKIISADGELVASKSLKLASDTLAENTISVQLRYLQTLTSISAEKNRNIIFPFPIDFFETIKRKIATTSQEATDSLSLGNAANVSYFSCDVCEYDRNRKP